MHINKKNDDEEKDLEAKDAADVENANDAATADAANDAPETDAETSRADGITDANTPRTDDATSADDEKRSEAAGSEPLDVNDTGVIAEMVAIANGDEYDPEDVSRGADIDALAAGDPDATAYMEHVVLDLGDGDGSEAVEARSGETAEEDNAADATDGTSRDADAAAAQRAGDVSRYGELAEDDDIEDAIEGDDVDAAREADADDNDAADADLDGYDDDIDIGGADSSAEDDRVLSSATTSGLPRIADIDELELPTPATGLPNVSSDEPTVLAVDAGYEASMLPETADAIRSSSPQAREELERELDKRFPADRGKNRVENGAERKKKRAKATRIAVIVALVAVALAAAAAIAAFATIPGATTSTDGMPLIEMSAEDRHVEITVEADGLSDSDLPFLVLIDGKRDDASYYAERVNKTVAVRAGEPMQVELADGEYTATIVAAPMTEDGKIWSVGSSQTFSLSSNGDYADVSLASDEGTSGWSVSSVIRNYNIYMGAGDLLGATTDARSAAIAVCKKIDSGFAPGDLDDELDKQKEQMAEELRKEAEERGRENAAAKADEMEESQEPNGEIDAGGGNSNASGNGNAASSGGGNGNANAGGNSGSGNTSGNGSGSGGNASGGDDGGSGSGDGGNVSGGGGSGSGSSGDGGGSGNESAGGGESGSGAAE